MHVFLLLVAFAAIVLAQPPDWENQAVFQIGKEAPRATSMPFPTKEEAISKPLQESPWYRSLNGNWKFHHAGHPGRTPAGFEAVEYDDAGWKEIPVPSNWQLHGYGVPLYSKSSVPFAVEPPSVMGIPPQHFSNFPVENRNQVGSYRRLFALPETWAGRRTHIVFGGVDSAFYLWVNGQKVGYSEDSATPAEFDITPFVKPGENVLAAQVFQHSDGSYFENHDSFRLSGIFRDVYLWSPSLLNVRDFSINAGLNEDLKSGTVRIRAALENRGSEEVDAVVQLVLTDPGGVVYTLPKMKTLVPVGTRSTEIFGSLDTIPDVMPWSAETPNLYGYHLRLTHKDGSEIANHAGKTGFRRAEIKDGQLLYNGQPILLKGVNRQDHHPRTGHHVTRNDIRADLLQMKRANINTIHTSRGPSDPALLEIADELGFYVIAGANVSRLQRPSEEAPLLDGTWTDACLDRYKNLVERDKNHPSILMWSVEEKTTDPDSVRKIVSWIKEHDPSRPVLAAPVNGEPIADLLALTDATLPESAAHSRTQELKPEDLQRPLIQTFHRSYSGNAWGAMHDSWSMIRSERLLQGGSISNWKDLGLLHNKHSSKDLEDRSGNLHQLDLYGLLSPEDGLFAGGVSVSCNPIFNLTEEVTLIAEAKLNAPNSISTGQTLISKGNSSYGLGITDSGELEFFIHSDGTRHAVVGNLPKDAFSNFHDYAATFDRKALSLFVDGKLVGSTPCGTPITPNAYDLGIAHDSETRGRRFTGSIRNAAVYSHALTTEQLANRPQKSLIALDFQRDGQKPPSQRFFAYGGDFNERPNDGSLAASGLVTTNLHPTPRFEEVKKIYQEIHTSGVTLADSNLSILVRNEHFFRSLAGFRASWKLMEDGIAVKDAKFDLPEVGPRESATIQIATGYVPKQGSEYFLRVRYDLAAPTPWFPAGMPVSWDELPLPWSQRKSPELAPTTTAAQFVDNGSQIFLTAEQVVVTIDKRTGWISSFKMGGDEVLHSPIRMNFWRHLPSRDKSPDFDQSRSIWQHAGTRASAADVQATKDGNDVIVLASIAIPAKESRAALKYRFTGRGQLLLETELIIDPDVPGVPRVGYQFEISDSLSRWAWYGRGPHENERDRNSGAWTTIHDGNIPALFHRHPIPQDGGNRTDIRWATLTPPGGGNGIRIDASGPHLLDMACSPFSAKDLQLATRAVDLPTPDFITINLDHPQHRDFLNNEKIRWSFILTPMTVELPNPEKNRIPR